MQDFGSYIKVRDRTPLAGFILRAMGVMLLAASILAIPVALLGTMLALPLPFLFFQGDWFLTLLFFSPLAFIPTSILCLDASHQIRVNMRRAHPS